MAERTVYCTLDDVQRWVKRVQFSDSTKITPSDINVWIQLESNIIDGELRKMGITLPISSSATISLNVLKLLISFKVAALAEQTANFGANKNQSGHGKWLDKQYLNLLSQIQQNPCILSDVVTVSIKHMKSDTEDMLEDGTKEGNEIFTKKHIDDFRDAHKVLSPSEQTSTSESITGEIPKSKI